MFKGYPFVLPEPMGKIKPVKLNTSRMKIIVENTAQEAISLESETWKNLETYLKPRGVYSFSPGLMQTFVGLYNESRIKKNPQFMYNKCMTSDVFITCKVVIVFISQSFDF